MSLFDAPILHVIVGFPRVSGDEPIAHIIGRILCAFSPRERG